MTQEEKFKEAQRLYKTANTDQKYVLESLFPELKESDDEKIRKALKEYFINSFQNNGVAAILGVHIKDILAWLEKQEHKPADMVEPDILIEESYQQQADDIINMVIKKPAWSEEDERMCTKTIFALAGFMGNEDKIDWLKSLRPQNRWKPSESDILLLERIANGESNPQDFQASLGALIGRLKKQMEE